MAKNHLQIPKKAYRWTKAIHQFFFCTLTIAIKFKFLKAGISKKNCFISFIENFKNDEKCFLFHLKSLFCSKDI